MFFVEKRKRKRALELVCQNGRKILEIDKKYLKDEEICLVAIMNWEPAFQFIDKSLKEDSYFCLQAVQANHCVFKFLPVKMRKNKAIIKAALTIYGGNFIYLPSELKYEKEYAFFAFTRNRDIYPYLCKRLREDPEFYVSFAYEGYKSIKHFPSSKITTVLCDALVDFHPDELMYVEDKVSLEKVKILYDMERIRLRDIPDRYISNFIMDEDDALVVLRVRPSALEFIPNEFLNEYVLKDFTVHIRRKKEVDKLSLNIFLKIPTKFLVEYHYKKDIYKHLEDVKSGLKYDKSYYPRNQKQALDLLKISSDFLDFFEVTNKTLLEAIKFNDEVLAYVMDENFRVDLEEALINDSLETFKEDHPEHFYKDAKKVAFCNRKIKELREKEKGKV